MASQELIELFDTVRLMEPVDGWPTGSKGTVVDLVPEVYATLEMGEDDNPDVTATSLLDSLINVDIRRLFKVTEEVEQVDI